MWLGLAGAALAPFATRPARAAQNASLRSALKYQDKPNKDQQCSICAQFIPGTMLSGRRSKRKFELNDRLEVVVDKVDRFKRLIDFRPA